MHTENIIDSGRAAELLSVHRSTVNRRVRAGEIPALGRSTPHGPWLFDRAAIEAIAADKKRGRR